MHLSRRLLSYSKWNGQASEWLKTGWGRRFRIGLLGGTIVIYPLIAITTNGPLVNLTFPRRFDVDDQPNHLKIIAEQMLAAFLLSWQGILIRPSGEGLERIIFFFQEYKRFLEREGRLTKDAVIRQHINKDIAEHETISAGSLGVRTGLHTAVPFFLSFRSLDEALAYFREHSPHSLRFLGMDLAVDWSSKLGKQLAETFVMSDNASRFVMLRDMYTFDGYSALAQRSISWATWTTFTSMFTYWLHRSSKLLGQTAMSFFVIYVLLLAAACYSNNQWHYLYRYLADIHADSTTAKFSFAHCEGGKEWYWKHLKRHRILREMHPCLLSKVKPSGDLRDICTPIITRFDHLKDLNEEDDELRQVMSGDD